MPEDRHNTLATFMGAAFTGGLWAGLLAWVGEAVWLAAHVGGADWTRLLGSCALVRTAIFAIAGIPIGGLLYTCKKPDDIRSAFAVTLGILVAVAVLWIGPGLLQRDLLGGHAPGFPHYFMLTFFALTLGTVLGVDAAWVLKRFSLRALYMALALGILAAILLDAGLERYKTPDESRPPVEGPANKTIS